LAFRFVFYIPNKIIMILNRLPKTVTYKGILCDVISGTWFNDNGKAQLTELNIKYEGVVIEVKPENVKL
jgi:hypothetical protein